MKAQCIGENSRQWFSCCIHNDCMLEGVCTVVICFSVRKPYKASRQFVYVPLIWIARERFVGFSFAKQSFYLRRLQTCGAMKDDDWIGRFSLCATDNHSKGQAATVCRLFPRVVAVSQGKVTRDDESSLNVARTMEVQKDETQGTSLTAILGGNALQLVSTCTWRCLRCRKKSMLDFAGI